MPYINMTLYRFILFGILGVMLSAVIPIVNTDIWFSQYMGLFFIFFTGLSIYIWERFDKSLALFSWLCLFSFAFTANQSPRSLLCVIQIYMAITIMKTVSWLTMRQRKNILNMVFFMVIVQGGMVILQYFNLDPIFNFIKNPEIDDTVGFSASKNQLGLFMATASPIVMSIFPPAVLINAFGLFCSKTTAAFVGATVGLGIFVLKLKSKTVMVFSVLFLILILLIFYQKFDTLTDRKLQDRVQLWTDTIQSVHNGKTTMIDGNSQIEVFCNPLLGFGIGNFIRISPFAQNRYLPPGHRYEHAHNDYIEAFFELGYIGLASALFILISFIYNFLKHKDNTIVFITGCAITAHLVTALGIYTVQTALSGVILMVLYGIFKGEIYGATSITSQRTA